MIASGLASDTREQFLTTVAGRGARIAELVANIALTITCLVAIVVLVRNGLGRGAAAPVHEESSLRGPRPGTQMNLAWPKQGRAVVLVLQTRCRYCSESAPFYRRLLAAIEAAGTTLNVVAILPDPPEVSRKYLEDLGLPIGDIRQSHLQDLGVRATPTLMTVDSSGRVEASWVGRIPHEKEDEVLRLIESAR